MSKLSKAAVAVAALTAMVGSLGLVGCNSIGPSSSASPTLGVLDAYKLQGDVSLVHDPSIIRQGTSYYALSTDPGGQAGNLLIRCSPDKVTWTICGQVFKSMPASVLAVYPSQTTLWAPDVSFFNGLYHVYYVASSFGTNQSLIGVATSPTMNPADANYLWTDHGIVLQTTSANNYNAIDPSILVDTDSSGNLTHVWMTYGSFYSGIFQRELNPATGMLSTTNTTQLQLATRPGVSGDPIEGPSLVKHNGYYYLFVSFGSCCNADYTTDTYQIAVGRGTSPNGPFTDQAGVAMLNGGGTIQLSGNGTVYDAPGGEDVYTDATGGDLITFHALATHQNGLDYLFVNTITWPNDWPAIQP